MTWTWGDRQSVEQAVTRVVSKLGVILRESPLDEVQRLRIDEVRHEHGYAELWRVSVSADDESSWKDLRAELERITAEFEKHKEGLPIVIDWPWRMLGEQGVKQELQRFDTARDNKEFRQVRRSSED